MNFYLSDHDYDRFVESLELDFTAEQIEKLRSFLSEETIFDIKDINMTE